MNNLLSTLYPVGAIYIGTQNSCPLATLIAGSQWEIVSNGRALWGGNGSNANSNIEAGLPNITGSFYNACDQYRQNNEKGAPKPDGAFKSTYSVNNAGVVGTAWDYTKGRRISFKASDSNYIYGKSNTVQPPAYIVNVWKRTV